LPPCWEQSGLQTSHRLRGKLVGMLSIEDLGHASLLRQPARGYGRWSSEAGKRELVAVIVTERVVTCDWTWTAEHPYF
jgi:hypothetical protein